MERTMSTGAESIDWGDMNLSNAEFQDEASWGNSALSEFTDLAAYADSPGALGLKNEPKPDSGDHITHTRFAPGLPVAPSASTESSSQDSSSDSSARRKRKMTSESPASDPTVEGSAAVKTEDSGVDMKHFQQPGLFQDTYGQELPNLSVEPNMSDNGDDIFDFQSAASSPNINRDFNQQLSLDGKMKFTPASRSSNVSQESPAQTINPGMFTLNRSRDQSPATTSTMLLGTASPKAIFSTPSSDGDAFNANATWSGGITQTPSWPTDINHQFTPPSALGFVASPAANGTTPSPSNTQGLPMSQNPSPLHIAPISTKSRVETQINVVMTLETPPAGIEHLHLPLHTIAKSKLLAKEQYENEKVLELHTMLVCTSAMRTPALKKKALGRAAVLDNNEIQRRALQPREPGEKDRNDPKNIAEDDKPANGGEVRICPNCIQRERKRAGRKKLKREEEQQHWERFESERVVVFNSNEYLPFKPFEPALQPQREPGIAADEPPYCPPEGALSVQAAMRIACYCRHQTEKEGFQVIFTLKDHQGNVVAQQLSDSILITDDHKTHTQTVSATTDDAFYAPATANITTPALPQSHSMVDLTSHQQPFQSSKSAGNLQALAYGQQLNTSSHVHQMSQPGCSSQTTSATMTPTSLSRPGSPNSAGQAGPNKKRKPSTFHRKVPSGLQMTPRVDTSVTPSSTLSSAVSTQMPGTFSPTQSQGSNQMPDTSYMTIPQNSGPAQLYSSNPPTPANEAGPFNFNQPHQLDMNRAQNVSAYFSHPSSAVPSRSTSPVLQQGRPNMAAYARQHPIQTPTNSIHRVPSQPMFAGQALAGVDDGQSLAPVITKITPNEGPISGGTEVSIFGYNFTHSTQIMFGDTVAPTTFYGAQCILATSPPGRHGGVRVCLVPLVGQQPYNPTANQPIFMYKESMQPQMMEMALRFLSHQQTGDSGQWMQYTNRVANQFMRTSITPQGMRGQGFGGGNMMSEDEMPDLEDIVLKIVDKVDASESFGKPVPDLRSHNGHTLLSMACISGMHRAAVALLARGANRDVRDSAGYTSLMHAALHGRSRIFQLLLNKGADPAMRSLMGYTAIDLVPHEDIDIFTQILQTTQRTQSRRPSMYCRSTYGSHDSTISSKLSWDIASASLHESEVEDSDLGISLPYSRHLSTDAATPLIPAELSSIDTTPPPAIFAWRDAFAAKIQSFQQRFQSNMPHFQIPALPPYSECYNRGLMRRLSLLASSSWGKLSSPLSTSFPVAPPSWNEFFATTEETCPVGDAEQGGQCYSLFNAILRQKRARMFRRYDSITSGVPGTSKPIKHSECEAEKDNGQATAIAPSWLWAQMSLAFVLCSVAMQTVLPHLSDIELIEPLAPDSRGRGEAVTGQVLVT